MTDFSWLKDWIRSERKPDIPLSLIQLSHEGTNEIKHAARVLSRYRDARRTRILRIRLRLTVRVKKDPCQALPLLQGSTI